MEKHFCSYSLDELLSFCRKEAVEPFRARQLFEWVYQKKVLDFEKMSSLKKELRAKLKAEFLLPNLQLKKVLTSKDEETVKFLFELKDKSLIESVLIKSFDRRTVCISSQVGCKGGCLFCASGKNGFFRNLKTFEIIEQVLLIEDYLKENISNVVFMGMGEPLDNFDNVVKAIHILNHPLGMNISQRKISVSTVGLIEKIKLLLQKKLKVNLVLSLHAPNQETREKLIPFARANPFDELLHTVFEYAKKTSRDITFEYVLLENINDTQQAAFDLIKKLAGFRHFSINLICYNPLCSPAVAGDVPLKKPHAFRILAFKQMLVKNGIAATQRYAKGADIAAACGQLALK